MIRLYYSSKNPCTVAIPPVGVQFTPQCIISPDFSEPSAKLQILFVFQRPKKKKVRKVLEDNRKMHSIQIFFVIFPLEKLLSLGNEKKSKLSFCISLVYS